MEPEHNIFRRFWRDYKQYGIGGLLLLLVGQLILNGFLNWVTALLIPAWDWIKAMLSGLNTSPINAMGWTITFLGIGLLVYLVIKVQNDIKRDVAAWKKQTKANELEMVAGKHFINQTIVLDGKHFVDCTFENCIIRWNGGFHTVTNIKFMGTPYYVFSNDITIGTIHFLKSIGALQKEFADTVQFITQEDFENVGFSNKFPITEQPKMTTKAKNKKPRKRN